jgi:hypothetical protein
MRIYLAGPLFTPAEREFLSECARTFRQAGVECFVPHEHELALGPADARTIFDVDYRRGILPANALVAWLDGPTIDDGTACEIGIFYGLMQRREPWRKGILGLCSDLRRQRFRDAEEFGGLNLFVAGTIAAAGRICWSLDEVLQQLAEWRHELDGTPSRDA